MPCNLCNGTGQDDQSYDRGNEQGQLSLGTWRWVSRCPTCGTRVYEPVATLSSDTFVRIDAMSTMSIFQHPDRRP
jgi:hypothetical protein